MKDKAWLLPVGLCLGAALLAAGASGQEPVDEAHFRRAIDRDPARALDELNARVRTEQDEASRARLRLLRAQALARLGEREDALDDLRVVLGEPREEAVETEAGKLVRALRGLDVDLVAPEGAVAPGKASVALVGSADGKLAVEWSLYRVDAEKLRAQLRAAPALGLASHLRRPRPDALARLDSWSETIEARGRFERKLPLEGASAPGIYLVAATVKDAPVRATVVVAKTAPLVKVASQGGLLLAVDQVSGAPRGGALFDVLEGKTLRELGTADDRGLLALDSLPASGELLVWTDSTLARLDMARTAGLAPAPAAQPLRLLVESPLVHPGETVRALAFSEVPASRHRVVLEDARGEALLAADLALDERGLGQVAFPVPLAAREGRAALVSPGGSASFFIAAPRERVFPARIVDALTVVPAGTPFVAHVRAALAPGASLLEARAEWTIRAPGGSEVARGTALLDQDGEARISVPVAPARTERELVFEARFRDPAGRVETDAVLFRTLPSAIRLEIGELDPVVPPRQRTTFSLVARNQDGTVARGVAVLVSATFVRNGKTLTRIEKEERTRPDGGIDLPLPLDEPGRFTIEVLARDAQGFPVGAARTVHVLDEGYAGEEDPEIRIRAARGRSRPGESVRLFVRLPVASGVALVTKERSGIRLARLVPFKDGALVQDVPFEEEDVPGAVISVAAAISGTLRESRAFLPVVRREPLVLETQLERALLGRDEPLSLAARAFSGKPRTAEGAELRLSTQDARPFELLRETLRARPGRASSGAFTGGLEVAPAFLESGEKAPREDDPVLLEAARSLEDVPPPGVFGVRASAPGGAATIETLPFAPGSAAARLRVSVAAAVSGSLALSENELRVEPELEASVSLPERLVQGDEGRASATIRASSRPPADESEGDVKVSWTARGVLVDGIPRVEGARIATGHEAEPGAVWVTLAPGAVATVVWNARAPAPGPASLEVIAFRAGAVARGKATALVLGQGAARERTIAGSLADREPFALEPGAADSVSPEALRAEIVLAPSVAAAARDAFETLASPEEPVAERGSALVLALVARLELLELAPLASSCGASIELEGEPGTRAFASLVELQEADGAWPGSSTGAALEGLSVARIHSDTWLVAGPIERGAASALRELASAPDEDRPALALALARLGRAPSAELARLFEKRAALSPFARAALGRALLLARRPEDARACARELAREKLESRALAPALLLLAQLGEDAPRRKELVHELLRARRGVAWRGAFETALSARALLENERARRTMPATELAVRPKGPGRDLVKRRTPGGLPSIRLVLDGKALAKTPSLELKQAQGDEAPFVASLSWTKLTRGLVPLEHGLSLRRSVALLVPPAEPAPCEPAKGVPAGSELRVRVDLDVHASSEIVLDEPIPAGARFLGEVGSSGARVSRVPGGIRVVFPRASAVSRTFSYALRAELPGSWHGLPGHASVLGSDEIEGESEDWQLKVR